MIKIEYFYILQIRWQSVNCVQMSYPELQQSIIIYENWSLIICGAFIHIYAENFEDTECSVQAHKHIRVVFMSAKFNITQNVLCWIF